MNEERMIGYREEKREPLDYTGPGHGRALATYPGVKHTLKVAARKSGGAYSLFEIAVELGGKEPLHIQHQEDECLYVVSGYFEFVIEGEAFFVSEGARVYIPKGTLHGYDNVGERTGKLLAIYTPGGSHEQFVEESEKLSRTVSTVSNGPSNLPPSSGANLERIRSLGASYGIEIIRDRRSFTRPVRD